MSILRLDIALQHLEAATGELDIPEKYPAPTPVHVCLRLARAHIAEAIGEVQTALEGMEKSRDAEH
jgi:hypothetical protein